MGVALAAVFVIATSCSDPEPTATPTPTPPSTAQPAINLGSLAMTAETTGQEVLDRVSERKLPACCVLLRWAGTRRRLLATWALAFIRNLRHKLNAATKLDAVVKAIRLGILTADQLE